MKMSHGQIAWYVGFIAGASPTYVALEHFGVEPHMARLVVAIVVGVGLGFGLSVLVQRRQGR